MDDLLHFSQLGRAHLKKVPIDMAKIMAEVRMSLETDLEGRTVDWEVGDLPPGWGDATLVRQALFNLVENAVKYTRAIAPRRDHGDRHAGRWRMVYTVADNGVVSIWPMAASSSRCSSGCIDRKSMKVPASGSP